MCARSRPNAIAVCGLCNWLSGNMVHLTQTLAVDEAKSAESSISTASTVQEKLHAITRSPVYFWFRGRAIISNLNQTTISAFCRLSILFRCSFVEKKTRSERRQNVLFLKMPMHKRRKRKTEQRNMKPTFASCYQCLFGVCVPSVIWWSGAVVVCDALDFLFEVFWNVLNWK